MVSLRRALVATALAATVACHGGFDPRDGGPDSDGADPCEGVTCSGHGACVDAQGVATCACDTGYSPSGIACIPTSADGDADVDADVDRDAPVDAEADVEEVACDDADGDGVCDLDDQCPGLDDTLGGQVNDEEFVDAGAWVATGIASVSDGHGVFSVDSCDLLPRGGALRQDACLPLPREGWPVLRAAMYWECTSCGMVALAHSTFVVTVGDDLRHFDTTDFVDAFAAEGAIDLEICPGEIAFGGIEPVGIDAELDHPLAFSCASELTVDHLWLDDTQPGVCPRPGEVLNGSVDPSLGGWSPNGAIVALSEHEGWISLRYPTSSIGVLASVTGRLGVPLATTVPSSALQIRVRGVLGEGAQFAVRITQDRRTTNLWLTDVLADTFGTFDFCFPPETLGRSASITMELANVAAERTIDLSAEIDDVAIVSAPMTCP